MTTPTAGRMAAADAQPRTSSRFAMTMLRALSRLIGLKADAPPRRTRWKKTKIV